MLSKIFEIPDVLHEYKLKDNNLFYLSKNGGVKKVNNSFELIWELKGENFYNMILLGNKVVVDNAGGVIKVIDDDGIGILSINDYGLASTNSIQNNLLFYRANSTLLFSLEKNKQIWVSETRIQNIKQYVTDGSIFGCKYLTNSCVIKLNTLNGMQNWQADLSSYGEVRKILGEAVQYLWVVLEKKIEIGFEWTLLALDKDTGQQLFKFDNALDSLSLGIELLPDKNIIISINTDGDKRTYYTVIDALKGMVVLRFEISTLKEAGFWEGKAFTIYNNRIYFITKELSTSFYCGVGIFNINTSKLEWVEKVNLKKGFLKEAPQTDGKRVYVLDSTGILHIYEIKKTSLAFVGM